MAGFLKQHHGEVFGMVSLQWDEEKARAFYESEARAEGRAEGKAEGRAEGRAEGKAEGKTEMVIEMLKAKQPLDFIARISNFSNEKISEIGRLHGVL